MLIAICGAVAGAGIGIVVGKRVYAATGVIRIAATLPAVLKETDQNRQVPMFDGIIQGQREVMSSRETIQAAMRDDAWQRVAHAGGTLTETQFAAGLKVDTRPRSDHLWVTFKHEDPAVAAAAVRSLIIAYQQAFTLEQRRIEGPRMEQLQTRRDGLSDELKKVEAEAYPIVQGRTAAELDSLCAAATERVKKLNGALTDVQCAMGGGPDNTVKPTAANKSAPEVAAEELLRSYTTEQTHIENQLSQARSLGCGPAHPAVIRLEASAREYQQLVVRQMEVCVRHRAAAAAATAATPAPVSLKDREASLRAMVQAGEEELGRFAAQRSQLALVENKIAGLRQSLAETDARMDALKTEASQGNRLTVISGGDMPMTALLDNRLKAGALGAMVGASVPFGLFILMGAIRRSYRTGDEVAEDLVDRVPFVAVLPDLHESSSLRLAAVHCIHDLRVRLQPPSSSKPRTYLITSAGAGEGKTSLSVALGLSFAAAGFRTLLVDCDLGSRDMTCGFDADHAPGLIEAIAGGEPHIRRNRAGLSVLATGRCSGQDACKLSPASAARVLAGVRDRFDVVLIDTDSIGTGLSASVIASQADGVLLAVARGQMQPHVQGAMKNLELLGARVSGVVFNKAAAIDFRAGVREETRPQAGDDRSSLGQPSRFGPLVGAMLASLSLSRQDDLELRPIGVKLTRPDPEQRAVA